VRSEPDAIHRARACVRLWCDKMGFDETLCWTAALLTSEAVTNALLHASDRARLRVRAAPEGLLVEIEDDSEALPRGPRASDPDALGGRGLRLVDELATRWGYYPSRPGKVVWFHLARSGLEEA
jgi:anti-sigma regulatory factor (Ser/Thr protein kinase)